MGIKDFLKSMAELDASDLFFRTGNTPHMRKDGLVVNMTDKALTADDVMQAVGELTTPAQQEKFKNNLDVDFAVYLPELERRFRVSIFMQRNSPSMVIRCIKGTTQTFEELNLPADILKKLSLDRRGIVLISGTMGSGKSTTIASMIEYINQSGQRHILTIEEPIEYTFKDKNCVINQRELGVDVLSYAAGLRTFPLQSPDVIYISNIRDYETMSSVITAAETGVLVLSSLHTVNASQGVERVINFFPPHQHEEKRTQLSYLLKGIISLRLVPLKSGKGRIPAYEVMLLTPTISRLIREGKVWEIPQFLEEGGIMGMQSFNQSLVKLVNEGKVSEEVAADFSDNKDEFILSLRGIRKIR
ncbi:MAG: PilT/PilU family type 4a pilus ATPase [Candidatus Omnitrophota bacterium]